MPTGNRPIWVGNLPERKAILESGPQAPARALYKYTQVKRLYRYGHFLGKAMKRSAAEKVGGWVDLATKVVTLIGALIHLFQSFS